MEYDVWDSAWYFILGAIAWEMCLCALEPLAAAWRGVRGGGA